MIQVYNKLIKTHHNTNNTVIKSYLWNSDLYSNAKN